MRIDRERALADLAGMRVDMSHPHLQRMLDAFIETDALFGEIIPGGFLQDYVVGMVGFSARLPADVLTQGARVLDVGAGHGRLLIALNAAFGTQGYGVDKYVYAGLDSPDEKMAASRQIWSLHDRIGLKILSPFDIEKNALPYPDDFFDLITSQQAIEHFHDTPKVVLDEMFRVLRPGGAVVLDTPNHAYWGYHLTMMRGQTVHWDLPAFYNHQFSRGVRGEFLGHTREFTLDELVLMFEWAGFEVVGAETDMYAAGADYAGTLQEYLEAVRTFMRTEYGAELILPSPERVLELAPKMVRLKDTAIIVARKPADRGAGPQA
jgi:SAM-dependent methyltransferase